METKWGPRRVQMAVWIDFGRGSSTSACMSEGLTMWGPILGPILAARRRPKGPKLEPNCANVVT